MLRFNCWIKYERIKFFPDQKSTRQFERSAGTIVTKRSRELLVIA